jgi:hypothetical protein
MNTFWTTTALRRGVTAVTLLAALTTLPRAAYAQNPGRGTELQVDGTLEVLYEDSNSGARLHHFLRTPQGRFELRVPGRPGLMTGSRVRVHGRFANGALELSSAGPGSLEALAPAEPNTFGSQSAIVMLVNFSDRNTEPYTAQDAAALTFGDVKDFYLENTYQQLTLSGVAVGWFTIDASSATCTNADADTWASLADQAAIDAGIQLDDYPRRIYAMPDISACGWWGLGTVGGYPSRAWVNGPYALQVVAHELGHNFGDWHSHSMSCNGSNCLTFDYGDDRDIMGNIYPGHMNAYQKERLGWLNYGVSPPIQTVTSTNNYFITPLETDGGATGMPKALRVLKSTDAKGNRTWYYVEYRTQTGFDSGAAPGVIVHTGAEANGDTSYQKDMLPSSSAFDSTLDPGQTFTDSTARVRISAVAIDPTGATVQVTVDQAACTKSAPTVTLSPAGTVSVTPGGTTNFLVTVKNNDGASCDVQPFALSHNLPAGWSGTFTPASVSPAPGASQTATLAVQVPAGAGGTQALTVTSVEPGGPSGSASATLSVATAMTATVTTDKATYTGGTVAMTATVLANGSPVSGATVVFTMRTAAGKIQTFNATTKATGIATASYKLKPKDPKGTWQLSITASKDGSTAIASTSFSIQ